MDRKKLEERLKQLTESRDSLMKQIPALQTQLTMHNGAIQDCEHWLGEMDKDSKANAQATSDTPGAPD